MNITAHDRPLKIVHDFPTPENADLPAKCAAATAYLHMLVERGFGGIVTNVCTRRDYTRNEEEWKLTAHVAAECARMGLRLWIYDEHGYPSGAADGMTLAEDPDYEATAIVMLTETVAPGETVTIPLPRGHRHFVYAALYPLRTEADRPPQFHPSLRTAPSDADLSPLSADEDGRYIPLAVAPCRHATEPVTLKNDTDQPAMACAFIQKRLYEGTHCVHNVFRCRRYIDVTNRDAVAAFLRNTYDRYAEALPAHFQGGTGAFAPATGQIEAFFTDEPSLMGCYINAGLYPHTIQDAYDENIPLLPVLTFGRDVENAFRSRFAYDIFPELAALFLGDTRHAMQVRHDYYTLLSDLYEQSFFVQISDWCARHNTNFSGHLLLEEDIRHHVIFEGNYFSLLRHMHYPGIDMLQSIPSAVRDFAFTPKLVSSVARAYGRPHVMSEVSAHAQGGKVTNEQMYASLCAQYALGVDVFTSYYSERFMDSETYQRYNTALARIHAVMQGRTITDCLLYYPIETFRLHHRPSDAQYGTYTGVENACASSLTDVMNALLDHQIDFDFADAESLAHMTATEDGLLSPAGDRYTTLILPPMEYTPAMAASLSVLAEHINTLAVTADSPTTAEDGCITPASLPDYLPRRAVTTNHPTPGLLHLVRDTEDGRACLLCNTNDHPVTTTLTVGGMVSPVLYDPMEDRILPCPTSAGTDMPDPHALTVTLPPLATYIVRES